MWLGAAGKSRADAGGDESSFLGAAGLGEDFERLLSLQESQASDKAATSGTGAANPPQKPAVRGISLPRPNAVPALSCRAIRTEDWGGEDGGGEWHIPASEAGHIQELERTYVELNGEIPTAGPGAGAGAAGGEVEEYEATPPAVKAMLRFQHAVQAQPRQVMRCGDTGARGPPLPRIPSRVPRARAARSYHYGAEPLWSCPPPRRVCGGAPGDPHVASGARLDSSGVAVAPPSDSARSSEHQGADGEPDPGTASGRAGCVEHASRAQEAPPAVAVPACACGKGRVFEAQLMPALASLVAESIGDAPSAAVAEAVGGSGAAQQAPNPGAPAPALPPAAEWTTALIYSCPDACASSSVEHALVVVE